MLCCCRSQLRPKKKSPQPPVAQDNNQLHLPTRPPPARLPPPDPHPVPPSPQSTVDRSSLTNPLPGVAADSSIQLGELVVVEDSDEDHGDDGLAHDSKNRSTSTLQAVKAAIRRHLSQDSLTRHSETEEQVARRAEVKRLMRQRIQEELRTETDQVLSGSSTRHRLGTTSIHLPGNGPRDTIEFTVDDTKKDNEQVEPEPLRSDGSVEHGGRRRLSRLSKNPSAQSLKENQPPSRPVSLQTLLRDHHVKTSSFSGALSHLRRRSSVPEIPSPPLLEPVRVPSFYDASSLASWRLSLSADKLAELFTPDRGLSLFRPVASSSDICSAADVKDWESIKHMRSKSSPLVVRDLEPASSAHSRQASLHSNYRTQGELPPSQSLIRGESPVGLWLRTQCQNFQLSTASQSAHDFENESIERPSSGLTVVPNSNDVTKEDLDTELAQTMNLQDAPGSDETPGRSSTMIRRKKSLPGQNGRSLSAQSGNKGTPEDSAGISQHSLPVFEPESSSPRAVASPAFLPSPPAHIPSVKENRWVGFNVLRLSYFQREWHLGLAFN